MLDDDEPDIIESPLSQNVTRDGLTVSVEIYRAENDSRWHLEVVDQEGASTVFDDTFESDSAALKAVLRLIDQEGIATFLDDHSGTIH